MRQVVRETRNALNVRLRTLLSGDRSLAVAARQQVDSEPRAPASGLRRHSYRSTTNGSTRVARRAGMRHAELPTTIRTTKTAPKVTGSCADTPNQTMCDYVYNVHG